MADTFKVIRQQEVTDFNGTDPVPAWLITYETIPSGIQGTVTVPKSQYTAAKVHEVIEAEAEKVEAVHNL